MDPTCHAMFHLPSEYQVHNISSFELNEKRFVDQLDTLTESAQPYVISLAILYVVTIFYLKNKLSTRAAYSLRTPLILWNFFMAALSLLFTYQFGIYQTARIRERGVLGGLFFHPKNRADQDIWLDLFAWSKIIELVDTLFIVLRKRPLISLHWSHHFLTVIYAFFAARETYLVASSFINSLIHTVMYTYYGLRALGYKVPRQLAMALTTAQIVQMIIGMILAMKAIHYRYMGCLESSSYLIDIYAILMFAFYTIMFGKYFFSTYINSSVRRSKVN
ncbi:putative fatty acid elongase 4 [Brevipalpus obovatus]|uniref:putative fatty acid elongase 4 n=1 Tax=Brevipalpus obovatus TaxID=246614 RepID=UPI003D9DF65F